MAKRAKEKICERNGNFQKLERGQSNSGWLNQLEEAIRGEKQADFQRTQRAFRIGDARHQGR